MRFKTRTSWNPAARIVSMYSGSTAAPPMQSAQSCGFSPQTPPTSTCTTMSASWRRPRGFRTRKISRNAACLSGTRFRTPLLGTRSDLRIQGLVCFRHDRFEVRHRLDLNFRRHVRDLYDLKRQLLRPCSLPLPCFDSVEAVTRQESRSLQRGEPPFGVLARNPEDGGDLVGGRQVLVVLQVLQDVRRAPLRKP